MSTGIPRVVAESLGGSALARAAVAGRLPEWYARRPATPAEWGERAAAIRGEWPSGGDGWYAPLAPAFDASGPAAARLARVASAGGVVVTTGQQPGLFGGPVYTLSKALSGLELADEVERATGIPTAPVFWAATDDGDFAEACFTWLRQDGGAVRVAQDQVPTDGIPLAEVPLEGIEGALAHLLRAAGSAPHLGAIEAVQASYRPGTTIGGAYLALLRRLLEPLGIAVIDASHPALLARERPVVTAALRDAGAVQSALQERERALRAQGYEPQVALVDGLTLVFTRAGGRKVRVPATGAASVAAAGGLAPLSPNVLLRPVVERAVLPTIAYVAGPGELAYFAQAGAVAAALGLGAPLGVPRWSCTIIEPHVEAHLARLGVDWRDLGVEHAVEGTLARAHLPVDLMASIDALRTAASTAGDEVKAQLVRSGSLIDPRIVDGTVRGMTWRVERLERRVIAAAKRREAGVMRDVATARGSLFPGGKRQERALNFIPFLAMYGDGLLESMRASARRHATALVQGRDLPADR